MAEKRRLHQESRFRTVVPTVPQEVIGFAIGDQAHGVTDLCLVKLTEGADFIHAAVHFMRFGRAWRTAEMTDSTVIAWRKGIDVTRGDTTEGLRFECRINPAGIKHG